MSIRHTGNDCRALIFAPALEPLLIKPLLSGIGRADLCLFTKAERGMVCINYHLPLYHRCKSVVGFMFTRMAKAEITGSQPRPCEQTKMDKQ